MKRIKRRPKPDTRKNPDGWREMVEEYKQKQEHENVPAKEN